MPSDRPPISAMNEKLKHVYVPAFDGIRSLLVVLVVIRHLYTDWPIYPHNVVLMILMNRIWFTINVFFCLSGFLITWILAGELEITNNINLRQFYLRRCVRLLPAYITAIVSAATISLIWGNPFWNVVHDSLYFISYTFNIFRARSAIVAFTLASLIGPAWSLCIEEQFYCCWSVLLKFFKIRGAFRLVLLLLVLFAVYRVWLRHHLVVQGLSSDAIGDRIYFGTDTRIEAVLAGCAAALALRNLEIYAFARHYLTLRFMPFLTAMSTASVVFLTSIHDHWGAAIQTYGYSISSILVAIWIVTVLVQPNSWTSQVLSWKPMVIIGRISYGIYILHFMLLECLARLLGIQKGSANISQELIMWGGTLALSIGVAALHYYVIELPLMKRRKRIFFIAVKPDITGSGNPAGPITEAEIVSA